MPDVAVPPEPRLSVTVTSSVSTMSWGLEPSAFASVAVTVEAVAPADSLTVEKLSFTRSGASSSLVIEIDPWSNVKPDSVPATITRSVPSKTLSSSGVKVTADDCADFWPAGMVIDVGQAGDTV